jgi:bacillopeptidase F
MGTMCGATNGGTGDTTGVAPGAWWIGDDAVGGGTGATFDNNVMDAYQWMADPDGNPGTTEDVPDVCQNSWGIDARFAGYTDCDNRWNTAIIGLETAGCVVTFSAGNEGPGAATHRSPGNVAIDSVTFFAIGAVDASTADTIPPLPMASFSSRGPSDCNGQIKPEVSAPGVSVYSSIPGGGYTATFSGTSMAGPHVAGIVALMRSANPNVDVRTIKSILMRTARDQDAAGNDNTSGFGLVDAYAAVLQVMQGFGRISGTVLDANTLLPIPALVSIVGGGQNATANGTGQYTMVVPGDSTYTVRYSLYGYTSQDFVLTVAADDTVFQDVNLVPRPIILLLNEDFEDGAPDWSHSGQAGWMDQWHVSTERAHAGTSSYKCGDTGAGTYVDHMDAYLVSPVITALPAEARFAFWQQVEAETSGTWADSAYDGGILEISANGGAFAQVTPTPAYNKQIRWRTSGGRPYNGPVPGVRCYTGNQTTWTNVAFDMAAYEGQDVQLRYRFCTDSAGVREGWYVDDVQITAFGTGALDPVTDLVVIALGTDLVLSWTGTGAPLYNIYSDVVPDGAFTTLVAQTGSTTHTLVNGYAADSKLFYIVRATDGAALGMRPPRGIR